MNQLDPDLAGAYLGAVEWAEREAGARRDAENARQWETGALLAAVESALHHLRQGAEADAILVLDAALTRFARGERDEAAVAVEQENER